VGCAKKIRVDATHVSLGHKHHPCVVQVICAQSVRKANSARSKRRMRSDSDKKPTTCLLHHLSFSSFVLGPCTVFHVSHSDSKVSGRYKLHELLRKQRKLCGPASFSLLFWALSHSACVCSVLRLVLVSNTRNFIASTVGERGCKFGLLQSLEATDFSFEIGIGLNQMLNRGKTPFS
jgi:hypothetical protein